METYSVQILNPKAVRLLQDLADLELITLRQEVVAAEATDHLDSIDDEKAKAREAVLRGSPNMDLDAMWNTCANHGRTAGSLSVTTNEVIRF